MRVMRVYHAGRDPAHRRRERALAAAGVDLVLVVPDAWPEPGAQAEPVVEDFPVVALPVDRGGDVNRHRYATDGLAALVDRHRPDLLDVHEEPFSAAVRQWLRNAPGDLPAVAYTAQNLDKRFPPPFAAYERAAYGRLAGLYPCSRQAASVAWGKGFRGALEVLPLGVAPDVHRPAVDGSTPDDGSVVAGRPDGGPATLVLAGRMVPEKGVADAVQALAHVATTGRPVRLVLAGDGPAVPSARELAARLGVGALVEHRPWSGEAELAGLLRSAEVVLVPSRATATWVEQYGRGVVEAQACGTPVVAYASGALPEVVGDAGLLVAEGDVLGLGRAVARLLAHPERAAALRERGLARAAERTWPRVARAQVAFYERVLAGPGPVPPAPSGRSSRAEARRLFGPPARPASGVERPFADPALRRLGSAQEPLGRLVDLVTGAARR